MAPSAWGSFRRKNIPRLWGVLISLRAIRQQKSSTIQSLGKVVHSLMVSKATSRSHRGNRDEVIALVTRLHCASHADFSAPQRNKNNTNRPLLIRRNPPRKSALDSTPFKNKPTNAVDGPSDPSGVAAEQPFADNSLTSVLPSSVAAKQLFGDNLSQSLVSSPLKNNENRAAGD